MSKIGVLDAKRIFYSMLSGEIDAKKGAETLRNIKTKNKVLKGYIFGVLSILNKKHRRYSFDLYSASKETAMRLSDIVGRLGDNRFLGDFEKGYFLAWKDFIHFNVKAIRKERK